MCFHANVQGLPFLAVSATVPSPHCAEPGLCAMGFYAVKLLGGMSVCFQGWAGWISVRGSRHAATRHSGRLFANFHSGEPSQEWREAPVLSAACICRDVTFAIECGKSNRLLRSVGRAKPSQPLGSDFAKDSSKASALVKRRHSTPRAKRVVSPSVATSSAF
jgi:hypothetical protein